MDSVWPGPYVSEPGPHSSLSTDNVKHVETNGQLFVTGMKYRWTSESDER